MSTESGELELTVKTAPDGMSAELIVSQHTLSDDLDEELCLCLIRAYEIQIDESVRQSVTDLIRQIRDGGERRAVIARGQPPIPGIDGSVRWTYDAREESPDLLPTVTDDAAEEAVDHYARSPFIMIEKGATLGEIIPPKQGVAGRDVTGRVVDAPPGRPARVRFDETIRESEDHRLVAQQSGVLRFTRDKVTIRNVLEVRNFVDFSTGHIDFDGDVIVHRGIKDQFRVHGSGCIRVEGLVEAASIISGENLELAGGMAGRSLGHLQSGGTVTARYLDAVEAEIGRDLVVEREAIGCTLVIHGGINAPKGTLRGGHAIVAGPIVIGRIGSEAGVRTTLELGRVPRLEKRIELQLKILASREQQLAVMVSEVKALLAHGSNLSKAQSQHRASLAEAIRLASMRLERGKARLSSIRRLLEEQSCVDIRVLQVLHAGVVFRIGVQEFILREHLRGSTRLFRDAQHRLWIRCGDRASARPLSEVCEVRAAA